MSEAPLLALAAVTKSYGAFAALQGIDLVMQRGEVVSIIGPSGCGKSTLLRCINFLEEPDGCTVEINGEPMGFRIVRGRRRRDREARIDRMRSRIGMVFQQFNVWPHRTALGNVVLPQIVVAGRSASEAERRGREELARVGLADKIDAYPAELSGGQLQRVAIARALAMDPQLMLFDEPTSALDPELIAEVLAVIRALAQARCTMIVVTHELRFAARVSDRIIFMDGGKIVESGPPQSVLGSPKSQRLGHFLARLLYDGAASVAAASSSAIESQRRQP
jgi:polar amino acid transport system ATP-binding protein